MYRLEEAESGTEVPEDWLNVPFVMAISVVLGL
jgi:hypothetical protein